MNVGVEVEVEEGGTRAPKLRESVRIARKMGRAEKARRREVCRSVRVGVLEMTDGTGGGGGDVVPLMLSGFCRTASSVSCG